MAASKDSMILIQIFETMFRDNMNPSFGDFVEYVQQYKSQKLNERLQLLFRILDVDEDGMITCSDMAFYINKFQNISLKVGDAVRIRYDTRQGIVRFIGPTKFAEGLWVGMEILNGSGKNNGTINGIKYFDCAENKGVFVQHQHVELVNINLNRKPVLKKQD
jgi:hypothetical protein